MCSAPPGEGLSLQGQHQPALPRHPERPSEEQGDGSLQPPVNPPQGRAWGRAPSQPAAGSRGGVTCSELAEPPVPARSPRQRQQTTVAVPPGMLQQGGVLAGHTPRFAPALTPQERLTSSIGSGHRSLGTARSPPPHIPRHPTMAESRGGDNGVLMSCSAPPPCTHGPRRPCC